MTRLCLLVLSFAPCVYSQSLTGPSLYCGHLGERNRIGDRLECAVGPHQPPLERYPFSLDNFYVVDEHGTKVEGVITRDAYTVTFVAKSLFVAKRKYKLVIDLDALNRKQKNKLRLSWDIHTKGKRQFCFQGMETIEDHGSFTNRTDRGNCR